MGLTRERNWIFTQHMQQGDVSIVSITNYHLHLYTALHKKKTTTIFHVDSNKYK